MKWREKVVGSLYNRTNFCLVTKPSSTLPKLTNGGQRRVKLSLALGHWHLAVTGCYPFPPLGRSLRTFASQGFGAASLAEEGLSYIRVFKIHQ